MRNRNDERVPDTQEHGSLDPPRRRPPTAVGAATPGGEQPRRPAELYDRARVPARARRRLRRPARLVRSVVTAIGHAGAAVRRQLQRIGS